MSQKKKPSEKVKIQFQDEVKTEEEFRKKFFPNDFKTQQSDPILFARQLAREWINQLGCAANFKKSS